MSSALLIGLLQIQNQIKLYHWQTHSHARHRSTDDFVHDFIKLVDTFVETYQGKYGRIYLGTCTRGLLLMDMYDHDDGPDKYLSQAGTFLLEGLPAHLDADKDTDLLNLRDEMLALVNQLQYLFTLK